MDRSFWSLHDDPMTFALLGLPTFVALSVLGLSLASVLRTFALDPAISYLTWAIIVPVITLTVITFFPLPCSVCAWSQAHGKNQTAGACFRVFTRRMTKLMPVLAWLTFSFFWWALLFWFPLLILWPRTCLAPMVGLFENQQRVFWRSRRLMHEDHVIHVLAGLYLVLILVLGSLVFLPRLILMAKIVQTPWAATIGGSIWAFELVAGVTLLTGVAMSWCIALTLFYHDLRYHREGEALRNKIDALYDKYVDAGEPT